MSHVRRFVLVQHNPHQFHYNRDTQRVAESNLAGEGTSTGGGDKISYKCADKEDSNGGIGDPECFFQYTG